MSNYFPLYTLDKKPLGKKYKSVQKGGQLKLDQGWEEFTFGKIGTNVTFTLPKDQTSDIQLTLTDAYCTGDRWKVYIGDSLVDITPPSLYDECETYETDPDLTLADDRWSSLVLAFQGISQGKVKLEVVSAPLGGGHAFIKVDTVIRQCDTESDLIYLSSPLVDRAEARKLCDEVGGQLAVITPDNHAEALSVLSRCDETSSGTSVWVASKRGRQCTVLTPTGDLVNVGCSEKYPVMCTATNKPVAVIEEQGGIFEPADNDFQDEEHEEGNDQMPEDQFATKDTTTEVDEEQGQEEQTAKSSSKSSSVFSSSERSTELKAKKPSKENAKV